MRNSTMMISPEPCKQPQGQPDADTLLQSLTCEGLTYFLKLPAALPT